MPLDYDSITNQEICSKLSRLRKIDWIFPGTESYNYKAYKNSYDLMIVDISRKSMSTGIEIGRALTNKIPILMLNHESFTVPDYLESIASYILLYEDEDDLLRKLSTLLCTYTVKAVSNEVEGVV